MDFAQTYTAQLTDVSSSNLQVSEQDKSWQQNAPGARDAEGNSQELNQRQENSTL